MRNHQGSSSRSYSDDDDWDPNESFSTSKKNKNQHLMSSSSKQLFHNSSRSMEPIGEHEEFELPFEGTGLTMDDSSSSSNSSCSDEMKSPVKKGQNPSNSVTKAIGGNKHVTKTSDTKTKMKSISLPQFKVPKLSGSGVGLNDERQKQVKRMLWTWKCISIMIVLLLVISGCIIYEVVFRRPMKEAKLKSEAAALEQAKQEAQRQKELEEALQNELLDKPKDSYLTSSRPLPGTAGADTNYVVEWIEPPPDVPDSYGKGQLFPSTDRANTALKLLTQITDVDMLDGNTPQNEAAYWMIVTDAQQIEPGVSERIDVRFVQRYALATMYYALRGSKWEYDDDDESQNWGLERDPTSSSSRTSWTTDTEHECKWWGIDCNSSNRVTKIELSGMNLRGTLPSEIQHLYTLEKLDLYRNRLQGRIPDLPSTLEYLDLERNDLTGPLPESLYYATGLEHIYLSRNELTGTLSRRLGKLTQLIDFRLWDNHLQGQIPTSVGELISLRKFMIYQNQFSGTLPSEFGLLSENLWKLDVGVNRIGGRIPSELGNCESLTQLFLHENRFIGTFPNEIGPNIYRLEDVWFYNNALTGTLPIGLGNRPKITSLLAHGNKFSGNVSQALCNNEILYEMTDFSSDCFSEFVRCDCCFKCY